MGPADYIFFCCHNRPDEWGPITVEHKALLDGGHLWSVTFTEYSLVAPAGGAPLLAISGDATTRGVVTIERVAVAASPAVHRVLVAGASTLEPMGSFELSLEGVASRAISVDASAEDMQNVSFAPRSFLRTGFRCNTSPSTQLKQSQISSRSKYHFVQLP